MTLVLACGEGQHDVGVSQWSPTVAGYVFYEGWLQPLIRKCAGPDTIIKVKQLKEFAVLPRSPKLKPIPKGFSAKAAMSRLVAAAEGCECVVFMTDADTKHHDERQKKVNEILQGFSLIQNSVRPVVCVPQATSESWLLSDKDAWVSEGLPEESDFPVDSPEDLWGHRNDPTGNHPKYTFARAAAQAGLDDDRETRRNIAEASAIDVINTRCPNSFGQFSKDISFACRSDI